MSLQELAYSPDQPRVPEGEPGGGQWTGGGDGGESVGTDADNKSSIKEEKNKVPGIFHKLTSEIVGTEYKYVENPNRDQIEEWLGKIGEGADLRLLVDPNTLYVWDAYYATHQEFANEMGLDIHESNLFGGLFKQDFFDNKIIVYRGHSKTIGYPSLKGLYDKTEWWDKEDLRVQYNLNAYSPDQERIPAGEPGGGQWTSDGGSSGGSGETKGGESNKVLVGKGKFYAPKEYVDNVIKSAERAAEELDFPANRITIVPGLSEKGTIDQRLRILGYSENKTVALFPDAGAAINTKSSWEGITRHEITHQKFSEVEKDYKSGNLSSESNKIMDDVFKGKPLEILDRLRGQISSYADRWIKLSWDTWAEKNDKKLIPIAIEECLAEIAYNGSGNRIRLNNPKFMALYDLVKSRKINALQRWWMYSPDQERVPAGEPGGGQWTDGGGGSSGGETDSDNKPPPIKKENLNQEKGSYNVATNDYVKSVVSNAELAAKELNFPYNRIYIKTGFGDSNLGGVYKDRGALGTADILTKTVSLYPDTGARSEKEGSLINWKGVVKHEITHLKFHDLYRDYDYKKQFDSSKIKLESGLRAMDKIFGETSYTDATLRDLKGSISPYSDYWIDLAIKAGENDINGNDAKNLRYNAINESLAEISYHGYIKNAEHYSEIMELYKEVIKTKVSTYPYNNTRTTIKGYSPDQPRVPAGEPGGGQWTDGGGGSGGGSNETTDRTTNYGEYNKIHVNGPFENTPRTLVDKIENAAKEAAKDMEYPAEYIYIQGGLSPEDPRRSGESFKSEDRIILYPDAVSLFASDRDNFDWKGVAKHEIMHQKFRYAVDDYERAKKDNPEALKTDARLKAIDDVFKDNKKTVEFLNSARYGVSSYADAFIIDTLTTPVLQSKSAWLKTAVSEVIAEIGNKGFRDTTNITPQVIALYDAVRKERVVRAFRFWGYSPDQERVPAGEPGGGQWTDGGGGGGEGSSSGETKYKSNPKVTDVGGDNWNKETAKRLEEEYVKELPNLDNIIEDLKSQLESGEISSEIDTSDTSPGHWNYLSTNEQEEVEQKWKENNYESYLADEQNNWETEYGEDDAKSKLASNFNDTYSGRDWASDALDDYLKQREEKGLEPIPYTKEQLVDALTLTYPGKESTTGGEYDIDIGFSDDLLQKPDVNTQEELLPGFEKEDMSAYLTEEMRQDIINYFVKEDDGGMSLLDKQIEDIKGKLLYPDYLSEMVNENLGTVWIDMSDEEKFDYAKEQGIASTEDIPEGVVSALPDKYNPLDQLPYPGDYKKEDENINAYKNYQLTQQVAKYMFDQRAKQLLATRGIDLSKSEVDIKGADDYLWSGWKESSTSDAGRLIQVAVADELGGRLRLPEGSEAFRKDSMINFANSPEGPLANYNIGGYEGLKALIRAKWETTQYLLDKAGIDAVQVYRAVSINEVDNLGVINSKKIPNLNLVRNGAASTTTDSSVANTWDGGTHRVVLRIEAPRTAVLSVPAYGQNVHHEHEVVLAGTAWKAWDAWQYNAPTFSAEPINSNEELKKAA